MIPLTDDELFKSLTPAPAEVVASHAQAHLYFFVVALAGFINRQQQDMIADLQEENRVLREKLAPKHVLLNVAQKRRLATAA